MMEQTQAGRVVAQTTHPGQAGLAIRQSQCITPATVWVPKWIWGQSLHIPAGLVLTAAGARPEAPTFPPSPRGPALPAWVLMVGRTREGVAWQA